MPLDYDELMKSRVYDPNDVPVRKSRGEIYTQIHALLNQYRKMNFDLGIKQFMMEQDVQEKMEDSTDRKVQFHIAFTCEGW